MTEQNKPKDNPIVVWEQEEALTKEEVMRSRGSLWHQTRIVVIIASSRSRMGRPMGGTTEAHCTCGWAKSYKTYQEACEGADGHKEEAE